MHLLQTMALAGSLALVTVTGALAESRVIDVDDFDKIDISTGITSIVTFGDSFSVTAESPSTELLYKLETAVSGGTFSAQIERSFFDFIVSGGLVGELLRGDNEVKLSITMPKLTGINASSGADVHVTAPTGDIEVEVSSGADVTLAEAALSSVRVDSSSGAGSAFSGTCETIDASASSGADVNAQELQCVSATAEASSGADVLVFASSSLKAQASSGGDVQVWGNPAKTDIDSSSGGDVTFDN